MTRCRKALDRFLCFVTIALIVGATVAFVCAPGCATSGGAAATAQAASAGMVAYRDAVLRGASREEAFRAATVAALATLPEAVRPEYRPFIEAALLVLAIELDRAKVSGGPYPSADSVEEAIENGIAKAREAGR